MSLIVITNTVTILLALLHSRRKQP
jgi:hypothetical protein